MTYDNTGSKEFLQSNYTNAAVNVVTMSPRLTQVILIGYFLSSISSSCHEASLSGSPPKHLHFYHVPLWPTYPIRILRVTWAGGSQGFTLTGALYKDQINNVCISHIIINTSASGHEYAKCGCRVGFSRTNVMSHTLCRECLGLTIVWYICLPFMRLASAVSRISNWFLTVYLVTDIVIYHRYSSHSEWDGWAHKPSLTYLRLVCSPVQSPLECFVC